MNTNNGWQANLQLAFAVAKVNGCLKTQLQTCRHYGPLRVQKPFYPEADASVCHVYILHPPGGVVGGDELKMTVHIQPQAQVLLTSPGSSKFYRSAGEYGCLHQVLTVENQASLEWFMQENIFFNGAKARLKTDIILEENARFIGWDIACLGRPACDEWFHQGVVDARMGVYRRSLREPLLIERLWVDADHFCPTREKHGAMLRGYPMQANFIATSCNADILATAEQRVESYIEKMDIHLQWGITLLDDILILRILGRQTEPLQMVMIALWQLLRPLILNRAPVLPRIWAT